MFGRMIFGTGRDFKYTIVFIDDVHTKLRHQLERDVDIRFGNQFAYHVDFKCLSGQGQSHQQGGQELAGNIAFNRNNALAVVLAFTDLKRRIVFIAQILYVRTCNAQRIHQIADGAFVHTRHAMQMIVATQNGKRGSQGAECRTGVA